MNNHLLSNKYLLLLAGLCYTFNSFADPQIKFYDNHNQLTESKLIADLTWNSSGSSVNKTTDDFLIFYPQLPSKEKLLGDLKPTSNTRNIGGSVVPCTDKNFQPRSVAISVRFQLNSYTLTKDARKFVDLLGDVLAVDELHDCQFEIEGHTDSSGTDMYNKKLSKKRANTVVKYLINQHSIAPSRLKAIGYGERKLLTQFSSSNYKQRRVQVKNVGHFRK